MTEKTKPTIDQIALLAGVSRSVVSRVLNKHPRVSEEARTRVLRVVAEQQYRPSSVARSLATDRTFEICLVTPRRHDDALANGFWPLLHLGISERCITRGYFVSLTMISADTAGEVTDRILNDRVFDGFILITDEVAGILAPVLQERKVPTVMVGHHPGFPDLSSVDVDNFDGAYRATRHLTLLGHRQIGAILGDQRLQETTDRRNGYLQALVEAGLSAHDAPIVYGTYAEQSGYDVMQQWLGEGRCPAAVFCGSDAIATGALFALSQAGRRVPGDVSLVGFDDLPSSRFLNPPLTTVHQTVYDKGVQAANLIIDQVEGRATGVVHLRLPARLVVRVSCGAVGAS